jgi:apolipoprotein D and lipocalin family protein
MSGHWIWALALLIGIGYLLTAKKSSDTLQTVSHVDLERYAGTWYEIASFPQRFQKGCTGTTATYTLDPNETVRVYNHCYKGALNGPKKSIKGKAFPVAGSGNSKLKVQFFWPLKADYWIIDLDPDYQWAVVSHPSRKYLWILNRSPMMEGALLGQIQSRLTAQGFDLSKLQLTNQMDTGASD